jgi:predicted transcriptional regulator
MNKRGKQSRIDRDKVLELHDRGLGVSAIARELGCTKGAISKILKAMGIAVVSANVASEVNSTGSRTRCQQRTRRNIGTGKIRRSSLLRRCES